MISCKLCGEENPVIKVLWHEDYSINMRHRCSTEVDTGSDSMVYEHGEAVEIDSDQFYNEYVGEGYDFDQDETYNERDDWQFESFVCGNCGRGSPRLHEQFTAGDELDALLSQLGNALKGRR